jgi:hypothetical protein
MIGERSELLARLLRYHGLVRSMADSRAREALRAAIAGIERRLSELDESAMGPAPPRAERPLPSRAR